MMKKIFLALSVWLSLCCAGSGVAIAQGPPNTGSPMVPNGGGSSLSVASGIVPNYIANNWYLPPYVPATGAGTNPTAGSIRLYPVFLPVALTINNLGVRVTTLSVGGNIQAAIYKNNAATGRPTGTALVSTASMSTTNVANVSAAASLSMQPGIYWFATNCDNATSIFGAFGSTSMMQAWIIGTSSQSASFSGTTGLMGLTVSQTFGTWPDLTAGSFAEVGSINSIPIVQFEVASVP